MKETLPAGVYTIEATTYDAETTGGYTLKVETVEEGEPPAVAGCVETVEGDGTRSGEWTSACRSANLPGSYARYYSFTLTQEREVTVTLRSGDADVYLYLREGDDVRSGTALNDMRATTPEAAPTRR